MDLNLQPPLPQKKDFRIGILGAGAVVDECHLPAYRRAGFNPVAIASRTRANAEGVAQRHGIAKVCDSCEQLLDDPSIEVLDIAVPPMYQPALIKAACQRRTVKGILAEAPLALSYAEAVEAVEACERAGITLAVNQHLRYDPSVRAAKTLLDQGQLGEPVFASIDLRAIPEWRDWYKPFRALMLWLVSVHQIDVLRYWFGNPDGIYCSVRPDPRRKSGQIDGINTYILEYDNRLRCVGIDDLWTGPAREGCPEDLHIQWRIEGLNGLATGNLGWRQNPAQAPAIRYATKGAAEFVAAAAGEDSLVDCFVGTMAQLLIAMETGTGPAINGRDNLMTLALVEAAQRSTELFKSMKLDDVLRESGERFVAASAPAPSLRTAPRPISQTAPRRPRGFLGWLLSKFGGLVQQGETESFKIPIPTQRDQSQMSNFTPRAQQVLALARKEADRFYHNFVGTEHLLLGIIALGQGVAFNVLIKLGLELETIRMEIEKQVGTGPDQKMTGNIPYTPRVKQVLMLAGKEAKALNHTYVGTEHILLGLLLEGNGVAARVLKSLDVNVEQTRQEILKELDPNFGQ